MGVIHNITKYPLDGTLTGSETLIGSDTDLSTKNYQLTDVAAFVQSQHSTLKDITDSAFDGYIVIARSGVGKDMSNVQLGDLVIGEGGFIGGDFVIMRALQDSPTLDGHFTIIYSSGASSPTIITNETFTSGVSQTVYVLATTPNNVDVFVDRVFQLGGVDYNIAGDTITFLYTPYENSIVTVRKY